jgi:hypothetical protein
VRSNSSGPGCDLDTGLIYAMRWILGAFVVAEVEAVLD